MNEWAILTYVLTGGLGFLVFLKIVCDEIVIKNRVLAMRVEIAEEERAKARAQQEAAALAAREDSQLEVAKPAA